MPSGNKYGAGAFNARADTSVTTEVYSGFGGATPAHFIRFADMTENRTLNFFDTGDQGCMSILTVSGYENYRSIMHIWLGDNAEDSTSPGQQYAQYSFYGPGFMNDQGTNPNDDYFYNIRSSQTDGILRSGPNGTTLPNTTAYAALNFQAASGGNQANWNSQYIVDSVGQTNIRGMFGSDLMVVLMHYGSNTINSTWYAVNRWSLGFFDLNDDAKGWSFNRGYWTGGGVTDLQSFNRDMMVNMRLNPDGFRWQVAITSVSAAHTVTFEVVSTFNTIATTITFSALGWSLTSSVGYKLGVKNLDFSTTSVVLPIQTNSVKPEAMFSMAADVKSIDYYTESADTNAGAFSKGFWTASDGNFVCAHATRFTANTTDFLNTTANNWLNYMYDTDNNAFEWGVRSLSPTDNRLDITVETNSPTLHGGSTFAWYIMGEKVAAPEHLMDANSVSILMADNSDYEDNLILVGSSAPTPPPEHPDPMATIRRFPTYDDREYPPRPHEIREFPVD